MLKRAEVEHAPVRRLISEKVRFLVPMTIIFMVGYIGLTLLAAFARGFLSIKVIGSVNLGFLLIAANYLVSWLLALVYVRIAKSKLDPLAMKAAAEVVARRV